MIVVSYFTDKKQVANFSGKYLSEQFMMLHNDQRYALHRSPGAARIMEYGNRLAGNMTAVGSEGLHAALELENAHLGRPRTFKFNIEMKVR
jgi:hypothetical protein